MQATLQDSRDQSKGNNLNIFKNTIGTKSKTKMEVAMLLIKI